MTLSTGVGGRSLEGADQLGLERILAGGNSGGQQICWVSRSCGQEACGTWWYLSQMSAVGTGQRSAVLCDFIPGLTRNQRRICQSHPDVMEAVSNGARQGVAECQQQFAGERWNCTTVDRPESGKILLRLGSREGAFVYAISSAAVVHSIAKACGNGALLDCPCGSARQGLDRDGTGEFSWGGCSDNLQFGTAFARRFIDEKERRSKDGRALMNLHNNRVGRKAVKKNLKLICKCHGVSGSCTTRTCWQAVGDFRDVGRLLYEKYAKAQQVTLHADGVGLVPVGISRLQTALKVPRSRQSSRGIPAKMGKGNLVFFDPSPDYCATDTKSGSVGTSGRVCSRNSSAADSCDVMCCGRGYDTVRVEKTTKCECKFVWCCRVECRTCVSHAEVHTCKSDAVAASGLLRIGYALKSAM